MTLPAAPVLPEKYHINTRTPAVSIDGIVDSILARATESPVLCTTGSSALQALLPQSMSRDGEAIETVIDELHRTVCQYYRRNAHPGFWGYVASPGLPTDPLGHAMTAALNQNVTGYHASPGAATIERTVIRWIADLAGLPGSSAGLIVSGGSVANLTAMATARQQALGPESAAQGLCGGPRPVVLAADSVHFSVQRAALLLGIGSNGVELIPTDSGHRMRTDILSQHLEALSMDRDQHPVCVVASAGTTATGAIDPLPEIAALCRRHGVWFHVDAAYGGAALFSPALRERLRGIEAADSITIDLHKWCYLAFDGSVLLYRDPDAARDVFHMQADYARFDRRDASDDGTFFDLSPEVSRRSRALPAYLAFRHYGLETLGRNVLHNVECAEYLAALAEDDPELELVSRPQLSICCIRYAPREPGVSSELLDELNNQIQSQLVQGGDFYLSPTILRGRVVLRVCICSYTTRASHVERLVDEVRAIGHELMDRRKSDRT